MFDLALCGLFSFVVLIGFYIWMIYGIPPSDEGTGGLASEFDKNKKVIKTEMMIIKDGKRVITPADASVCGYDPDDFP